MLVEEAELWVQKHGAAGREPKVRKRQGRGNGWEEEGGREGGSGWEEKGGREGESGWEEEGGSEWMRGMKKGRKGLEG